MQELYEGFCVNLNSVKEGKNLPGFIFRAILSIEKHKYLNVSSFIKNLSDEEIELLTICFDQFRQSPDTQGSLVIRTLVLILITGEGCPMTDNAELLGYCLTFGLMLYSEKLQRKNMGVCVYENFDIVGWKPSVILFKPNDEGPKVDVEPKEPIKEA